MVGVDTCELACPSHASSMGGHTADTKYEIKWASSLARQVAESMVWQDEGEVHAESAATYVEPDADAGVGPAQKSRLGGRQRW